LSAGNERVRQANEANWQGVQGILDRIPASPSVNQRTFDLDSTQLSMLLSNASLLVDEFWVQITRQDSGSGLITSTRRISAARRRSLPIWPAISRVRCRTGKRIDNPSQRTVPT
jgi:hypothetical protein